MEGPIAPSMSNSEIFLVGLPRAASTGRRKPPAPPALADLAVVGEDGVEQA